MAFYQQSFPFSSQFTTWEQWNGNLLIWFGEQPIPMHPESMWKNTASVVASTPFFEAYPIPFPDTFLRWQDWADEFAVMVNGPSGNSSSNVQLLINWINNSEVVIPWTNISDVIIPWYNTNGGGGGSIKLIPWDNDSAAPIPWTNSSLTIIPWGTY